MADAIKLPPLPTHPTNGLRQWWTPDQLRARDLEVARVVLAAAANAAGPARLGSEVIAGTIRALEVSHG